MDPDSASRHPEGRLLYWGSERERGEALEAPRDQFLNASVWLLKGWKHPWVPAWGRSSATPTAWNIGNATGCPLASSRAWWSCADPGLRWMGSTGSRFCGRRGVLAGVTGTVVVYLMGTLHLLPHLSLGVTLYIFLVFFGLFLFFSSNLYAQHGAGTHDPKIETPTLLFRLSQPGAPRAHFKLKRSYPIKKWVFLSVKRLKLQK